MSCLFIQNLDDIKVKVNKGEQWKETQGLEWKENIP